MENFQAISSQNTYEGNTNTSRIKVIDSIMGSGKTSWAINYMNESDFGNRFIYITPFLREVDRIKASCTSRNFIDPINKGDGKLKHLKELVNEGQDIVTTHALFQMADKELIELIRAEQYILILDEVMDVQEDVQLNMHDLKLLLENGIIQVGNDNFVKWNDEKGYYDTKYNNIRDMASLGTLMYTNNILMWTFPVSVFKAFKEVYILTYYFEAQIQRYYYDLFNVGYEYLSVVYEDGQYKLILKDQSYEDRSIFKELINIYDGKLNTVSKLSKTWLTDSFNAKEIKTIKRNTSNYFRNILKAKSSEILWTSFKDVEHKLKGKGYAKGFIPCTERATNKYSDRANLAYLLDRYMRPIYKTFFISHGIKVNEDKWALSEMLQWIWRSAIRDNKPINIYIPSPRMRGLLKKWLDGSI